MNTLDNNEKSMDFIVTFKAPYKLVSMMDLIAQQMRMTRSELIRRAVMCYILSIKYDDFMDKAKEAIEKWLKDAEI